MFLVAGLVTDTGLSHNTPVVIGGCFFFYSHFLRCLPRIRVVKPLLQQPPIQSFLQAISILGGGRWHIVVPHTNQRLSCFTSKCIAVLKIEMASSVLRRGNSHHFCKEITECCSSSYHLRWTHWLTPEVVLLSDGESGRFWGCTIFFFNLVVFSTENYQGNNHELKVQSAQSGPTSTIF